MKRKFLRTALAFLLILCLCLPLAACGGGQDGGADEAQTEQGSDPTEEGGGESEESGEDGGSGGGESGEDGGSGGGESGEGSEEEGPDEYGGLYFKMPEGGFDTVTPVTITFYHSLGASARRILDTSIEEFCALYPNITVKHEQIGAYDDIFNQISTQIVMGKQPDLAFCYPEHVVAYLALGDAVLPLNDFLADGAYRTLKVGQADGTEASLNMTAAEQENFIEGFWQEGARFGDGSKRYLLPYAKTPDVLYYNETFFEDNGLSVPATWDEMETTSARIKEIAGNESGKFAFGYDSTSNWFIGMCAQSGAPYLSQTGGKYLFDTPTARAFVERFKGWYDRGFFTTRGIEGSYTSNLFRQGYCYMSIGSCASATYYLPDGYGSGSSFEVGVAPVPSVSAAHTEQYLSGPSVCIFKNDDPQRMLASWLFLKFLATNVDFQAEWSMQMGYMPVLKESAMRTNAPYAAFLDGTSGGTSITARVIAVAYRRADSYFAPPALAASGVAREQVGLLMDAVFAGTKTTDEAFRDAVAACTLKDAS